MRLTQVISNFLNNAIKYTSEGCITLAYEIIGDEIKFSVTDTGDGMSQEIQAHIFDRFYKGNTFKQGTGLGLSICETIVNRLGLSLIHIWCYYRKYLLIRIDRWDR